MTPVVGGMMIKTPAMLSQCIEKFMLDISEPLDPLLSLQLTQLVVKLGDMAYAMGYSDGQQEPFNPCEQCPTRGLIRSDL
jgi:hypothetical protein